VGRFDDDGDICLGCIVEARGVKLQPTTGNVGDAH
jgi:hypothetical protein